MTPDPEIVAMVAKDAEIARLRVALHALAEPVPSTRGLDPSARAARLLADLERRVLLARDVLQPWTRGAKQRASDNG